MYFYFGAKLELISALAQHDLAAVDKVLNTGRPAPACLDYFESSPKSINSLIIRLETECNNYNAVSCSQLGLFYEKGIGTKKNLVTSNAYYLKACKFGHTISCYADKSLTTPRGKEFTPYIH